MLPLLILLISAASWSSAYQTYQLTLEYPLSNVGELRSSDALGDGTVLIADRANSPVIEVRRGGAVIREYSLSDHQAVAAAFGPLQTKCVAFRGPKRAAVLNFYGADGGLARIVALPDDSVPFLMSANSKGELIIFSVPLPPFSDELFLIYKYDSFG